MTVCLFPQIRRHQIPSYCAIGITNSPRRHQAEREEDCKTLQVNDPSVGNILQAYSNQVNQTPQVSQTRKRRQALPRPNLAHNPQ